MKIVDILKRYGIIPGKKKGSLIIFWVIISIIVCFFVFLFFIWASTPQSRAKILRDNPIIRKLLPIYWQIRKISDLIYLPYYFQKDNVPTYELYIKPEDKKKMDESLPKEFMEVLYTNKVYVPAEFKYEGKIYKVKVRYRGDNAVHWNAPKKSYLIKFDKDDLFKGARKLSFIIPEDRKFIVEHFNNYRAQKLGLPHPQSHFANLNINGKNHGLYFAIEGWSKELLAKWEVSDESNFYGEKEGENDMAVNIKIFDTLYSWQELTKDNRFNYDHYSEIYQLQQLLNNSSDEEFYDSIFNLVDKENFYLWQIHQELVNSVHQAYGNKRLYFNNSTGKFYFIPWDLETGKASEDNADFYGPIAQRIFLNPIFLYEKNKKLYDYASNKDNLKDDLAFYDNTYSNIKVSLYKDRMKIYSNRYADKIIKENRRLIKDNIKKIRNNFKKVFIVADIVLLDDNSGSFYGDNILAFFDFNVLSFGGLFLNGVKVNLDNGLDLDDYRLYYDANFNNQLDNEDKIVKNYKDILLYTNRSLRNGSAKFNLKLTKHRFYLTSSEISSSDFSDNFVSIKFDMENAVTGVKVKDINFKVVNSGVFKHFGDINDIDKLIKNNPMFRVSEGRKEIVLPQGLYNFKETVIIPKGYEFVISPGTQLRFSPGASLISYSNVVSRGTKQAPINFSGIGGSSWGVFAVLNSGEASIFEHSRFRRGSGDYINGVYFSGMLSVYHSDVRIKNSEFYGAQTDDAINIKYGKAEVVNSIFRENGADAIDFDFVKEGEIGDNEFYNNGNDSIDLSGSNIIVRGNYIANSGDKCISVGEKSLDLIIYNNVLNNCNIGVETKDLSDIKIINNVIINNKIGVNAYRKKSVFGGGKAEIYNSILWNNGSDIKTDNQSNILVYNSDIKDGIAKNSNFSAEPVFNGPQNKDFTIKESGGNMLFISGGNTKILKKELNIFIEEVPVGLNK